MDKSERIERIKRNIKKANEILSLKKSKVEFISKDLNLHFECSFCGSKARIRIKLEELIPFDVDCRHRCSLCMREFRIVFSEKPKKENHEIKT